MSESGKKRIWTSFWVNNKAGWKYATGICVTSIINLIFFHFQKEKIKVYIDEKYHHAYDPSIRPSTTKRPITNPLTTTTYEGAAPGAIVPAPGSAPPSEKPSRASTLVRQATKDEADPKSNYGKDIKDIPRSTWKLLTNKIYIVTCLGACMELIIVSGFIVFLPKYLETQFNLSKIMASIFTGGIAIPGACIGIIFGGYILKRLQVNDVKILSMSNGVVHKWRHTN